jgi:nucleoside-diphosphate-sugar epimerase
VKKILLTGSNGFIGSNLLQYLSKNNKVYTIIRKKSKNTYKNKNINQIYFNHYENLNKKLKLINVDVVIHCATHYIKNHDQADIKKLAESNILLGNILLENLTRMRVKKFINFSTVWENYDGKKDNFYNLYSVYKKNFRNIIDYYKKILTVKFYNLIISDTFGNNDLREKIINTLRKNYKKGKITKIISKKLFINFLNVEDIVNAVDLLLKKDLKPDDYILKNNKNTNIYKMIKQMNNSSKKKIRIKWVSNKKIEEKIYNYKKLKGWKPSKSKVQDIIDLIKK